MRITGGSFKNRRLAPLKGIDIRPTSDRVREAIFSILGQDLHGFKVLDLFAGTGCLGLEALSRNALKALFVDSSPYAIRLINENVIRCGCRSNAMTVKMDLSRPFSLESLPMKGAFDLIFVDPPYQKGFIPSLLGILNTERFLSPAAKIVAESSSMDPLPDQVENLKQTVSRFYGETRITIYTHGKNHA
jgi:16S rRNA (guanine966-N2)-methyltransferase